ncbi:MAG: ribosome small subunit-dependent GTPase A [Chloroflexota bacterium]
MDHLDVPAPAGAAPLPHPVTSPLAAFGWTPEREAAFADHRAAGHVPGRVVLTAGLTRAQTADGPVEVVLQRRFRHEVRTAADLPAVGDWLALEPLATSGTGTAQAAARAVLHRSSAFSRGESTGGDHIAEQVVAANVDTVLLVSALTHDLNPRRIERYLLLAYASGAAPVLVLNKADLAADLLGSLAAVGAVAGGVPIHPVSAVTGEGLAGLGSYLAQGRTVCLLGSSGVGKSTLANALLGETRQLVRAERSDDSRGRHTTTARELFPLPGGALLIDTPGLRSVGLWDDAGSLDSAFDDVARLAAECRFSDCRHEGEPGCAVRAAIADGELAEERLESHRKLERELRSRELREDVAAARAESRRWGRMARAGSERAAHKRGER